MRYNAVLPLGEGAANGKYPIPPRGYFASLRSGGQAHAAIDLVAPTGTSILAPAYGYVIAGGKTKVDPNDQKDRKAAAGQWLYLIQTNPEGGLDLGGRFRTATFMFAHLSAYSIRSGSFARKGQKVAEVGNTGEYWHEGVIQTYKPHLHMKMSELKTSEQGKWMHLVLPKDIAKFLKVKKAVSVEVDPLMSSAFSAAILQLVSANDFQANPK